MSQSKLPLVQVADDGQNRYNQSVKQSVDALNEIPFLSGRMLESVALLSGNNVINHKLGRTYQGFWVTKNNAAVIPYDSSPGSLDKTLQIQLTVASNVTVNLWVF